MPSTAAVQPRFGIYKQHRNSKSILTEEKNHVARVGSNTTFLLLQKRRTRTLFIEDAKGTVLSHIELTSNDVKSEGYYDGYNLLADVPITAGDFDGDGSDEVAVTYTTLSSKKIR